MPVGAFCKETGVSVRKPVHGSWFEFQHCWSWESGYWDKECAAFTSEQWQGKIAEMAEIGMQYLVLLSVAQEGKSFYPSGILPKKELGCKDPMEAVLSAADKHGIRFFISGGFFDERIGALAGESGIKQRMKALGEIVEKYGSHPSFYGWYWPNEAELNPYFKEDFIRYVNQTSEVARMLKPGSKVLIAPFGTRRAKNDDAFVKQLEQMDVDCIAYQDEVGVQKSKPEETAAFYEILRKAHDRVPQRKLWADVEIFDFEGTVYKSNLIPAPFQRVEQQLKAVSPYVDEILVYQYQGMINKPGSKSFAGHPKSEVFYQNYLKYMEEIK